MGTPGITKVVEGLTAGMKIKLFKVAARLNKNNANRDRLRPIIGGKYALPCEKAAIIP